MTWATMTRSGPGTWRYEGSLWVAPFGLVGCTVVLTFRERSGSHHCIVEAFAPATRRAALPTLRGPEEEEEEEEEA